jgi:hypothetical protein
MPKGYWAASGKFFKGIGKPLGNAQIPQPANRREGRIYQRLVAKTWQFPSLVPEGQCFYSHLLKVQGAVKKCLNAQWLFPIFALSNHATFSQTQTGATVPLSRHNGVPRVTCCQDLL